MSYLRHADGIIDAETYGPSESTIDVWAAGPSNHHLPLLATVDQSNITLLMWIKEVVVITHWFIRNIDF